MKKGENIIKKFVFGAIFLLLPSILYAHTTLFVDTTFYSNYPYIRFVCDGDTTAMSDDEFYATAARIGFAVNQAEPPTGDQFLTELKNSVLPRINKDSLELTYMVVRGAASPDGPYEYNKQLGERRSQWLLNFIRQQLRFSVNEKKFRLDSEAEDYNALCFLMRRADDKDYDYVKSLCDSYLPTGETTQLKTELQRAQDGQLWKRLNKEYFYQLRTARIILYFKKHEGEEVELAEIDTPTPVVEQPEEETLVTPVIEPVTPEPQPVETELVSQPRRELLAIKTNLLFYGAYIPGYDRWCPIPNVAVEYYPKRGHFTLGASFDMPWWQDYDAHKYFQLRNYQVEGRYYLRAAESGAQSPAYAGWYVSAYGHGGVFGICFDADRGWVGEGLGCGLGVGYVMPISRNGHWRLEFGLQAGFFRCKYDPYQYENPIDPNYHDNLYYYKWTFDADLFKERQYRWNWIGPTRVGITLSYDLLYKRQQKRGVSFKSHETYKANRAYETNGAYEQERRTAHE